MRCKSFKRFLIVFSVFLLISSSFVTRLYAEEDDSTLVGDDYSTTENSDVSEELSDESDPNPSQDYSFPSETNQEGDSVDVTSEDIPADETSVDDPAVSDSLEEDTTDSVATFDENEENHDVSKSDEIIEEATGTESGSLIDVSVEEPDADINAAGNGVTYTLEDPYTLHISGSGDMADYNANNTPWYENRNWIKYVVIDYGVTRIGNNAFNGLNISELTIPDSVTSIGSFAFANTKLATIFIPKSVTSMPQGSSRYSDDDYCAFYGVPNIIIYVERASAPAEWGADWNYYHYNTYLTTNWGYTRDEYNYWDSFQKNKDTLTSVEIESQYTRIPNRAFDGFTRLASVKLPTRTTSIGGAAFRKTAISSITIPDSVTSIGSFAFANTKLATIFIPKSVTSMPQGSSRYSDDDYCAFYGVPNIIIYVERASAPAEWGADWNYYHYNTYLTTNWGYTRDEYNYWDSFQKNKDTLTSVEIESQYTRIPNRAFDGFTRLASVKLPTRTTSIGGAAFRKTAISSITIPDSVTSIGSFAFANTKLATIFIPKSVTSMPQGSSRYSDDDYCAFYGVPNIIIYVERASAPAEWGADWNYYHYNTYLTTNWGYTRDEYNYWDSFQKNKDTLTSVEIESQYTRIPNRAFDGFTRLASVKLPTRTTSIGGAAFRKTAISSITIPDSVTSIGSFAFANTKLATIFIPKSVTSMPQGSSRYSDDDYCAFYGVPNIIIYVERASAPAEWGADWNYYHYNTYLTTNWGYTREQYINETYGQLFKVKNNVAPFTKKQNPTIQFSIKPSRPVIYESLDPDIVIVDSAGTLTGRKPGKTEIIVSYKDHYNPQKVEVRVLFSDVTDPSQFFYRYVYSLSDRGVINGWDDGTFRPDELCNRAAIITFLWKLAGKPAPRKQATFRDMTGISDFDNAISWGVEKGIVTGWEEDNSFRPWDKCNRAAIITFLWRYAGKPAPEKQATFRDMTGISDFDNAISWGVENGITTGWSDNTFRPWDKCKRLAAVSFLGRSEELN